VPWPSSTGDGDHARSGRPKTNAETRDLIRRMRSANPFWAAHGIHGELLKLGVEVSQASKLPRRRRAPSPNSRSFLHNHLRPWSSTIRVIGEMGEICEM
jgi:hypothetical protein